MLDDEEIPFSAIQRALIRLLFAHNGSCWQEPPWAYWKIMLIMVQYTSYAARVFATVFSLAWSTMQILEPLISHFTHSPR